MTFQTTWKIVLRTQDIPAAGGPEKCWEGSSVLAMQVRCLQLALLLYLNSFLQKIHATFCLLSVRVGSILRILWKFRGTVLCAPWCFSRNLLLPERGPDRVHWLQVRQALNQLCSLWSILRQSEASATYCWLSHSQQSVFNAAGQKDTCKYICTEQHNCQFNWRLWVTKSGITQ